MRRTSRQDAHHFALASTVLVHAAVGWWMLASSARNPVPSSSDALDVVWIEPPPAPETGTQVEVVRAAPTAPAPALRAVPRAQPEARVAAEVAEPLASESNRTLSAVFVEQGRALARAEYEVDFRRNPLTSRAPVLAGTGERIRMREPMSAARIAAGIGQLFGGAGYETSPCPRIERNIAALGTGGNSELLQEEVRRHRQFCE